MTSSTVPAWHIDGHRPRVWRPGLTPVGPRVRGSPDGRPQPSRTPGSPATTASRVRPSRRPWRRTSRGPARQVDALAAVRESRLLVPVVAVLGEVEVDERGLAHDKTSDMATVLLQGADGRMALLAFSGMPALQAWDAEARPVPVTARTAAQAALQDGAAAIVVDVAGPATFVVEGQDLEGLAQGWTLAQGRRPLRVGHPWGIGTHPRSLVTLASDRSGLPIPG